LLAFAVSGHTEPSSRSDAIEVRPVYDDDRPSVIELLATTFPSVEPGQWHRLFDYPWMSSPPDYGHLASLNGEIVGFLGAIYQDRSIEGSMLRICSTTSWCVRPDQRSMRVGTRLCREYIKDKQERGVAILILTAGPHIRRYLMRVGCETLRPFRRVRYALPPVLSKCTGRMPHAVDPAALGADEIGEEALEVVRFHVGSPLQVRAFEHGGRFCVVVSRRRTVKIARPKFLSRLRSSPGGPTRRLPRAVAIAGDLLAGTVVSSEVIYVSDREFFREHRNAMGFLLALADRTAAMTGDPRLIGLPSTEGHDTLDDYLCLNIPDHLDHSDFDALYSELVLLDFDQGDVGPG
jgi:hypothetical protein